VGEQSGCRVLVIQPWTVETATITSSLREAGIAARVTTIDFEAALDAALHHEAFDVAIYDETPGLTEATVRECFRRNQRAIPLVSRGELATLASRVQAALERRRN